MLVHTQKGRFGFGLFSLTTGWLAALWLGAAATGDDWPQFGRDGTRNAVSPEKGPPTAWDNGQHDEKTGEPIAGTTKNVKWRARLGTQTVGDPVVVDGLIWVGTNNPSLVPYDASIDASVLACFRESDGKLLYRYVSPRLAGRYNNDWPYSSMACSPLIQGDRIWFVTNRAEVVCLDIGPLKQNVGDPRMLWKVDLIEKYGVYPSGSRMTLMRLCSIAGYRDLIYVVTGNNLDVEKQQIVNPDAPSLLCLRKETGEEVWQDKSPGENILYGQSSSPTVVEVGTRAQCIVGQGDGWVRSFDALTGELIWRFDMNRKESKWFIGGGSTRNSVVASPVFAEGRVYIAGGNYVELGEGSGRLVCLDPTRQGDISSELAVDAEDKIVPHRRIQAVDAARGEKAVPNPNSALIWEFEKAPEARDPFEDCMHRTVANVAVHNGLVVACDWSGLVHCFDAATGKRHWAYDIMASVYASPLIIADKFYIADESGWVSIFGLSSDPNLALRRLNGIAEPLHQIEMEDAVYCSPIFANGVLYLASKHELCAVVADRHQPPASQAAGYWPQWRGPNRDNVSVDTGLMGEWPAEGPPRSWTAVGLGEG
ncbi:MAG TPA: PQQ-binding-like beta-propeller repeat protein, partial [Pirellulales bacterium]|nr:PQQ-binding-like beta-propeller repeat protein [Pirellulales bacterium]